MNQATILYYVSGASPAGGMGSGWLGCLPPERRERFERSNTHRENAPGPDGKRGLLVTWQTNVLVEWDAKAQDWRKIGPQLWVGVRKGYDPAEFAKPALPHSLSRYSVELGDGNRWLIPVALADSPNYSMPWVERFNEDGQIVRQVSPAYAEVCAVADELWRHVDGEGGFQMDEGRLRQACADALAVHYQVDLSDCLAMGLFTSESYQSIVAAILDFPAIDQIRRGKARVQSDTGSGCLDASAGTSQPTPTSHS